MEIEIIRLSPKGDTITFAEYLNGVLSKIKLMHWYTTNYNLHVIFDKSYKHISDSFDALQEEIIGISRCGDIFPNLNLNNTSTSNSDVSKLNSDRDIIEFYKQITLELKSIINDENLNNFIKNNNCGINNTKEEILSEINKSLYLISMINI